MQDNAVRWFAPRYGDPHKQLAVYVDRRDRKPAWASAPAREYHAVAEPTPRTRGARACSQPDPADAPHVHRDRAIALRVAPAHGESPGASNQVAGRRRSDRSAR